MTGAEKVARYRVFAQVPGGKLDLSALCINARRFFNAAIEILHEEGLVLPGLVPPGGVGAPWVSGQIQNQRLGLVAEFRIVCRAATPEDWEAARRAEQQGRATGMATLAARCEAVWEVEAETLPAMLNLCAVLASVALGPVLPADESTLFGIRGSLERLEACARV